ncbi:MAG TPA: glycosyltransferase family 2 protein [Bryobacteraceae bacterium]
MPAVSVVVPLFNKERYIRRCLESVCRQTMPDFEVIVVDDGSSDSSAEMAEGMADSRTRVVRQENRGGGGARNRGIREARGELIAFLDADDEWRPEFLEAVMDLGRAYPEAGILATGYRRYRDGSWDMETTLAGPSSGHRRLIRNYLSLAMKGNPVCSSNTAIPQRVLAEIGGFPEGERYGEDRDLWVRVTLKYPVAYDVRILSIYHSEALGRVLDQRLPEPPLPPAVPTLRRALKENRVPADKLAEVRLYSDAIQMQCFYAQLHIRHEANAKALLTDGYLTARYNALAVLWRVLLIFLPMRVLKAIRLKPQNAMRRVKGWLSREVEYHYGELLIREVPAERG